MTTPSEHNILHQQGDSFVATSNFKRNAVNVDLTGAAGLGQIRDAVDHTGALIESFTFDFTDGVNGNFIWSLSPAETAAMTPAVYYYEVEITESSGRKTTLVEGTFTIVIELARP